MDNNKVILLPLDGSPASRNAIIPAKGLAAFKNRPIELLYVSDEKLSKEELLDKLQIQEFEHTNTIVVHKSGDVVEKILEESKHSRIIVMATHGETSNYELTAGSIATSVMELSDIPVLIVRPETKIRLKNHFWHPKKALIPLNGTPGSAQALEPALKILAKVQPEINLLHIPCKEERPTEEGALTAPYYQDYQQYEWPSWSREFCKRFFEILKEQCNVDESIKLNLAVAQGEPGDEIIKYAKLIDADFIAIAWHGKLGPLHAQVLKKIIAQTPCPIMLVKIR